MAERLALWTPTDWNKEAALRIEYIRWRVQHKLWAVTLNLLAVPAVTPEDIMRWYSETGYLCYNGSESETPAPQEVTYEYWLENIR